ncbi:MAG: acyl-CoA synthetase [Sneathiella sp.]
MSINIADLNEAIAAAIPDREAIVFRNRRFTYSQFNDRACRLANVLLAHGITLHKERHEIQNWESGQDHVALYMFNGNEYPEGILATLKARAVPVNVNFRYVEKELIHLLNDASVKAIIYHQIFAPTLAKILADIPTLKLLIQVEDGSGHELLPGALEYEAALASASSDKPATVPSPDDIYMIYTGGTTGMPKGVLWRQGDFLASMLDARNKDGSPKTDISKFVSHAVKSKPSSSLAAPPYMHGTGQLVSFLAWHSGNTVILLDNVEHLNPAELLKTAETEKTKTIALIGDAFARPILAELQKNTYDLTHLRIIVSSGAIFSNTVKDELIKRLPHVTIVDAFGSTETGAHVHNISTADQGSASTSFELSANGTVLSEDKTAVVKPGHKGRGWFAVKNSIPLGYLGDEQKTRETFPTIQGVRYIIPGDRVILQEDGSMEFLGRDSATITSGGEKIFAEEVEQAIKRHPDVEDVVVTSRPSEKWGQEVVAVVQTRADKQVQSQILEEEAAKHIARYKLPKAFIFTPKVKRGENGKVDYRWAKALAAETLREGA